MALSEGHFSVWRVNGWIYFFQGLSAGIIAASRIPLRFPEDRDVGIGVFPEIEEILVSGAGLGEGVRAVARLAAPIHRGVARGAPVVSCCTRGCGACAGFECIGASQTEMSPGRGWFVDTSPGWLRIFWNSAAA